MKKIALSLLTLSLTFTQIAKADSWDNMTESQAKNVVTFIEKNPFILIFIFCSRQGCIYIS